MPLVDVRGMLDSACREVCAVGGFDLMCVDFLKEIDANSSPALARWQCLRNVDQPFTLAQGGWLAAVR